jgi:DNA-binding HxlR family transcriptional regulator
MNTNSCHAQNYLLLVWVMLSTKPSHSDICARRLKVLADDTRLAVLKSLMQCPQHVGQLNEQLNLEQSLLSHHLQVLRREGFVTSVRHGKAVLYCLSDRTQAPHNTLNLGCCMLSFD